MEEDKKRSSLKLYHLKQILKELDKRESLTQSTSLITLYMPPNTQMSEYANLLRNEAGTASNIKDKKTGKAVQDAIASILARLPNYEIGKNGLVIFAGLTANKGKVEFFAIDPPEQVGIKTYRCEKFFDTEHLKTMLDHKEQIGVIAIDRGGATFAVIKGNEERIISDEDSFVPSKHGRGGQSQGRIERGIEILAQEFFGKMAEKTNKIFLEEFPVKHIIIGGPAMSKDDFLEHNFLDYRIREKIFKVYDVGYTGKQGIREIIQKAEDDLGEIELIKERNLMDKFKKELSKTNGRVTYGEDAVRHALKLNAVDIVLFSEAVEKKFYHIECKNCEYKAMEAVSDSALSDFEITIDQKDCPKCNTSNLNIVDETDLIDEFEQLAVASGATIEVVGVKHEEGEQLFKVFTGIAALLRFPLDM
jgi:peptide chain release factor subunit 1